MPGSLIKVQVNYGAVQDDEVSVVKGETVVVEAVEESRYRVKRQVTQGSDKMEGFIPLYVLNLLTTTSPKGPSWAFKKLKKPSFSTSSNSKKDESNPEKTNLITVLEGDAALLEYQRRWPTSSITWQHLGMDVRLAKAKRVNVETDDHQGRAVLRVINCSSEDTGEYQCVETLDEKTSSTSFRLVVQGKNPFVLVDFVYVYLYSSTVNIPVPDQPRIEELRDNNSALLFWPPITTKSVVYSVESSRLHSNEWKPIQVSLDDNKCWVSGLQAGETYGFRVVAHLKDGSGSSQPSPPSQPLSIPIGRISGDLGNNPLAGRKSSHVDLDALWQRDFERQYIELEELGRGRFSVVRRCQQILTGNEVAVKFINRRKQDRDETRKEFDVISRLKHPNLVSTFGLFLTATSDAIVIELVAGASLLEHLCQEPKYSETKVCEYMKQILDALQYLHGKGIIHFDLKVGTKITSFIT